VVAFLLLLHRNVHLQESRHDHCNQTPVRVCHQGAGSGEGRRCGGKAGTRTVPVMVVMVDCSDVAMYMPIPIVLVAIVLMMTVFIYYKHIGAPVSPWMNPAAIFYISFCDTNLFPYDITDTFYFPLDPLVDMCDLRLVRAV
jgi:hypothetical protein